MSQEKVDRYKHDKANRKSIIRKQRIEKVMWRIAGIAVIVILVGWLGYSGYSNYESKKGRSVAEVDVTAVSNYLTEISTESAQ